MFISKGMDAVHIYNENHAKTKKKMPSKTYIPDQW